MKIALAQQNYHIGNFENNVGKIINGIRKAREEGAELVVFSELSVCGYPPRDFLEFSDFIAKCYQGIEDIKPLTDEIAVIIGVPQKNPQIEGKDLFNSAVMIYKREVIGVANKTLLPTYDIFDEYRYFEPAMDWNVIEFKGKKIALTICEDIWNIGDNPLYVACPMDSLIKQSPDLMINISASPFDYDHDEDRKEVIRANAVKYKLPLFYCNAIGSQTEVVFDGGSLVFDRHGNIRKELKYFEEDFAVIEWDEAAWDTSSPQQDASRGMQILNGGGLEMEQRVSRLQDPEKIIEFLTDDNNIHQIKQALILGIRDYFQKMGFKKAVLGSSGGVDSAVVLALACEALGAGNVKAVLMPSEYSTGHSVSDAEELSKNLENPYEIIAIADIYQSFLKALKPAFKDLPFSVAEENLQSRI
ncbi:MAG: NAD(+) synthase, partial [Chitinophagaceae bacterium]